MLCRCCHRFKSDIARKTILPTVVFCQQPCSADNLVLLTVCSANNMFCQQPCSADSVFCQCHVVPIVSCHTWLTATLEKTRCPALHLYKGYSSKGLLCILGGQTLWLIILRGKHISWPSHLARCPQKEGLLNALGHCIHSLSL